MWVRKGVDGLNIESVRQQRRVEESNPGTFRGNYEIEGHFKLANNLSNNLNSYINVCVFLYAIHMHVCVIAVFMTLLFDGH